MCIYKKMLTKVAGQLGRMVELFLFAICQKCDSKPLQIKDWSLFIAWVGGRFGAKQGEI